MLHPKPRTHLPRVQLPFVGRNLWLALFGSSGAAILAAALDLVLDPPSGSWALHCAGACCLLFAAAWLSLASQVDGVLAILPLQNTVESIEQRLAAGDGLSGAALWAAAADKTVISAVARTGTAGPRWWCRAGAACAVVASAAAFAHACDAPRAPSLPRWSVSLCLVRLAALDALLLDGLLLALAAKAAAARAAARLAVGAPVRGVVFGAALLATAAEVARWHAALAPLVGAPAAAALAAPLALAPDCLAAALVLWHAALRAAGVFLALQWNSLLVEVGAASLLTLLLAPAGRGFAWLPALPILLLRFTALKLLVSSGIAKLVTRDGAWARLTAMHYHHLTQPLPHAGAWIVARAPAWVHTASTAFAHAAETVVPPLAVAPLGRLRVVAVALSAALQLGITASGSYGFFNALSAALLLACLRDRPSSLPATAAPAHDAALTLLDTLPAAAAAATLLVAGWAPFLGASRGEVPVPAAALRAYACTSGLRVTNAYGLFATMTVRRVEPVIEASETGEEGAWRAYALPHKPGDLDRAPRPVLPPLHMPLLDWRLWFAPLSPRVPAWLLALLVHLHEGTPAVLDLFASRPLGRRPAPHVRVQLYEYRFRHQGRLNGEEEPPAFPEKGVWWQRRLLGTAASFPPPAMPRGLSTGEKLVFALRAQRGGGAGGQSPSGSLVRRLFAGRARIRTQRRLRERQEDGCSEGQGAAGHGRAKSE